MYHNFVYPTVTEALPSLLVQLEIEGSEIGSRAGLTKELTHVGITLTEPLDREILCDFRKPNIAAQIAETMWVLAGRDDIAWLENYLPRVRDFSDDGEVWRAGYGARLRRWEDHGQPKTIDQWRWLIEHMKEDRATRRGVMSIWDPSIDTAPGKDLPCNDWLSFLSREGRLDLHVGIRSNDIIWGWSGINQFEWSALLEVTAGMLGITPGSLHFSTTSFHLYGRHFAKAEKIRTQTLHNLDHLATSPRFDASVVDFNFSGLEALIERWFQVEYDIRTGSPLVQHYVDTFPEPMFRSWIRVLQWWWSKGDTEYLRPLAGTRLFEATRFSVQPKKETSEERAERHTRNDVLNYTGGPGKLVEFLPERGFIEDVCALHDEKHKAYGDSWKRRGEMLGIMANIARKVDRLGKDETSDETSADTAQDLMVYLAKYRVWLDEKVDGPISRNWGGSENTVGTNEVLRELDRRLGSPQIMVSTEKMESNLRTGFDALERMVVDQNPDRINWVKAMLEDAYLLARTLTDKAGDEYRGADAD